MLSGRILMLSGMIIMLSIMIILLGGMIIMISRMIIMLCGMNARAALRRVYTLGPELHKDLLYIVLCFTWTCFLYRSLTLLISTCTAPMSTLKRTLEVFSQLFEHSYGLYKHCHSLG
jgi:hypothetical protein